MKDKPLVSCIMPTFNRRTFVPRAITYFLRQAYPRRELIIVDDGADAVGDLVPEDSRIHYVRLQRKLTTGAKRNLACRKAKGEIIANWDDDDWIAPWRLDYQVEQLTAHGADVCGLDRLYFFDPKSDRAWQYVYPQGNRPWLAGGTMCYTTAFWRRNPFPDANVGEDTRFVWSRTAKKVKSLDDNGFYVAMIHADNSSPKMTSGSRWRLCRQQTVARLLGEDLSWYAKGGKSDRNLKPHYKKNTERAVGIGRALAGNDKNCRVTVSLPYYRCKSYIRKAVESVLSQTHRNLRLVVMNDGDPDPPWDVLAHIDDPRLFRFDLPSNRGRYFADAVVVEATDDPYFMVQDADDWSEPNRIEKLLQSVQKEKSSAAISVCQIWRKVGSKLSRDRLLAYPGLMKPLSKTFEFRSDHHGLFRTEALRRIGGYYAGFRIGYDTFIINMLLMTGKISYVKTPLYNRLYRENSLTTSRSTGMYSLKRRQVRKQLSSVYGATYKHYEGYLLGRLKLESFQERIRKSVKTILMPCVMNEMLAHATRLRDLLYIDGASGTPSAKSVNTHGGSNGQQLTVRLNKKTGSIQNIVDERDKYFGEWAISQSVASELAKRLAELKPARILELGSGFSTIILAQYASERRIDVVTLEHSPKHYKNSSELLDRYGLGDNVDFRLSPLISICCDNGETYPWYRTTLKGKFDFVFIDGPPLKHGREAVLFALCDAIAENGEIWLHDGHRPHELYCVETWKTYFDFSCSFVDSEKGIRVLKDVKRIGETTFSQIRSKPVGDTRANFTSAHVRNFMKTVPSYWKQRRNFNYYQKAIDFARKYVPEGGSVLDVGSRNCDYITWFTWFEKKQIIDLERPPKLEGVLSTTGDFLNFESDSKFDLVLCLQVLEHLENPKEVCKKLISIGKIVIVSIPYKWPRGLCRYHLQDPADDMKLQQWMGKRYIEKAIVRDNKLRRLIAVFKGTR